MAEPTYHLALTADEAIALSNVASMSTRRVEPNERIPLLRALQKLLALVEGLPEVADG